MKFGLTLPSYVWPGLDYQMTRRITRDMARRGEELGFDSLTVWDHLLSAPGLYGGSWLDPLMVLSCAAGVTEAIPLGTHILVVPSWHPVLLAKERASLDFMSGGRFFFGVGPGWNEPEFTSMGVSMRQRGCRTDELLDAVKLLLTQEHVSFQGEFYQFEDVTIEPRPETYFTVWIAGGRVFPTLCRPTSPTWSNRSSGASPNTPTCSPAGRRESSSGWCAISTRSKTTCTRRAGIRTRLGWPMCRPAM
jgi:hypothetical protein